MKVDNIPMFQISDLNVKKSTLMSSPGFDSAAENGLEKTKKSFDDYVMEAFSKMNDQQMDVAALQEKVITEPDSVDIHDVTIAMAKAQMSMTLAKTVVDRVVTGWNEITTTR